MKEEDIRPKALHQELLDAISEDARDFFRKDEEFVRCPCIACGNPPSATLFTKFGFPFCRCSLCQTLYASRRPKPQALQRYYKEARSVFILGEVLYKKTAESRKRLLVGPKARRIADMLKRFSIDATSLLDIGAGHGGLLEELSPLMPDCSMVALDPSSDMCCVSRSKGFDTIQDSLEAYARNRPKLFDVAVCMELFEHLQDPREFLNLALRVVKPGGIFVLSTLSGVGFDLLALGEHADCIIPPMHLNFITPDGVRQIIRDTPWVCHVIATPGELDVDIVRKKLDALPDLRVDLFYRRLIQLDDDARRNLQRFLAENGLSSHMWFVLQRSI